MPLSPAYCLRPLLLACLMTAATAAAEDDGCTVLYTRDDPRLFDFVATRQAEDPRRWQGLRIERITVVTLPIFNEADKRENHRLYRGINRLHTPTRADTLQRQLLLKTGEPLDSDRLRESERILRGAGYLYDAMIIPEAVCADSIRLLVVARDIWTLQPTASFKRAGGENSTSFGITDDNLLGYGHGINLSWKKNAERSGLVLGFDSKHLLDGHTHVAAGYARNDDGRRADFSFDRPFYAFDSRWAAGITGYDDRRGVTESAAGVTTNRYDDRHQFVEAYAGYARPPRDGAARRWRLGLTHDHQDFDRQDPAYSAPLPADRRLAYPWLEFERRENTFITTSNLSQLFRNEDVSLGEEWRLRVGATNGWLPSATDALIVEFDYDNTVGFGAHHLLRTTVTADLHWDETAGVWVDSVYGAAARYDYLIDPDNRWHAQLSLDAGRGLSADRLLKAGGDTLLRGYPAGWQQGDRRLVLNVERRHFYRRHVFNLFRLGSAAFAEVGQAWDRSGTLTQSERVLADIGIGLRINSSKARPNHVMHLDLAAPLTDRGRVKGLQWSLQAQQSF
jgi:hypothetical protein